MVYLEDEKKKMAQLQIRLIKSCVRSLVGYNCPQILFGLLLRKVQTDSIVVNKQSTLYFLGINQHEATLTFRYNRGKKILTSDVQIPDVGVDFGTNFRITDESISGKKAYTFVLDVNNKKITEVSLTGQIR